MRTIIVFFIALLAFPVVQIAFAPRLERTGAPVLIDRSSNIFIAVGKQPGARDIEYPMSPRSERRPKTRIDPSRQ
jgi:hypothetical protein